MNPKLQVFNFSVQNKSEGEYDVHVDGYIVDSPTQELLREFWNDETSVSYKSFRNEIEKVSPKVLNVIVNSGGGHVGDAFAMHDFLNDLEKKGTRINRIGRGIVASAATYLVMGNNSEMSENSFFMIHNVFMVAIGDINQVENQVKAGRKFNDAVRDFYSNHSGNPPETIASWMNKETWMTGKEAADRGFVKNCTPNVAFTNSIPSEQWPFANTAILNTYNSFTNKNTDMDFSKVKEAVKNALKELGFSKPEDESKLNTATEAISNAVSEQLKPFENLNETINTAVTNAMTEALKDLTPDKIGELVTNKVTEATKDLAKKEDVTKLETDVANKLGNKAKEKGEDDGSKEHTFKNKKEFFRRGEFQKN